MTITDQEAKILAKRIDYVLFETGLTQKEFGTMVNCRQNEISRALRGGRKNTLLVLMYKILQNKEFEKYKNYILFGEN